MDWKLMMLEPVITVILTQLSLVVYQWYSVLKAALVFRNLTSMQNLLLNWESFLSVKKMFDEYSV